MSEFKTPEPPRGGRTLKRIEHDLSSPPVFTIPPSPCMKQLGYGTGVNVYLMERFSPLQGCYKSPWAVKKINRNVPFIEFGKRLSYEADILKELNHPNIIGYRSYTNGTGNDGTQCLMMESGEKSLLQIIEDRQENGLGPLPAEDILKVARDIVAALQYLHEEKLLLHGDLKSANILIKGNFRAVKLCDFGIALKLDEKGIAFDSEDYVGTECWSAPEALICGEITQKTDMFSFGLTIWEMLTLHAPHIDKLNFDEINEDCISQEDLEAWEAKQTDGDQEYQKCLGTRPALPNLELGKDFIPVVEIFYACTESDPSSRPSASQVLRALNTLEEIKAEVREKHEREEKEIKTEVMEIQENEEEEIKAEIREMHEKEEEEIKAEIREMHEKEKEEIKAEIREKQEKNERKIFHPTTL